MGLYVVSWIGLGVSVATATGVPAWGLAAAFFAFWVTGLVLDVSHRLLGKEAKP